MDKPLAGDMGNTKSTLLCMTTDFESANVLDISPQLVWKVQKENMFPFPFFRRFIEPAHASSRLNIFMA
jgi:hypothetical protein